MNVHLPIFAESQREPDGSGTLYRLRPLLFDEPLERSLHLSRATAKLAGRLKRQLEDLCREGRHREVVEYTFSPETELHRLDLRLALRRQTPRVWLPVVTFRHLGRRLAFCPLLPEVWFEVGSRQALDGRAAEVYTRWFRDLQKQQDEDQVQLRLEPFTGKGTAWITHLDVDISTRQEITPAGASRGLSPLASPRGPFIADTCGVARVVAWRPRCSRRSPPPR